VFVWRAGQPARPGRSVSGDARGSRWRRARGHSPRGAVVEALARKQRAADAGGIELVVAAMQAHPQVVSVQDFGCCALFNVCYGSDAAARARRQRAVIAGATEAVAGAMQAHPGDAAVQRHGQRLRDLLA